ncbi:hypothetical protein C9374_008034 [Naegleria lovaniensis]|uniref:Zn(2)-C6 fungal-type domain-containing protein n=1 Tax=Naegleria lovaniensis TaxID=51637 RepID=A0AA88GKJ7_NAELO|nr:uncharacterized protein C9374_008034 [Naegleria lovaniensis]KAG2378886.1 hypothetical protein C9374_008034 [Naegleria lovaniensis]
MFSSSKQQDASSQSKTSNHRSSPELIACSAQENSNNALVANSTQLLLLSSASSSSPAVSVHLFPAGIESGSSFLDSTLYSNNSTSPCMFNPGDQVYMQSHTTSSSLSTTKTTQQQLQQMAMNRSPVMANNVLLNHADTSPNSHHYMGVRAPTNSSQNQQPPTSAVASTTTQSPLYQVHFLDSLLHDEEMMQSFIQSVNHQNTVMNQSQVNQYPNTSQPFLIHPQDDLRGADNSNHAHAISCVGENHPPSTRRHMFESEKFAQTQQAMNLSPTTTATPPLKNVITNCPVTTGMRTNTVPSNTNSLVPSSTIAASATSSSTAITQDDTVNQGKESNLHPIACSRCRERHKRCDRKLPSCGYCEKQGLPCNYTTPKKQRRVYQRAVPVPAGNDVSSITMVTGGGSSGSFFTSTPLSAVNSALLTRRGSVDSNISSFSATSAVSTSSSTGGSNSNEATNAFEIFTFRWQGNSNSNSKSSSSNKKKRKSVSQNPSETPMSPQSFTKRNSMPGTFAHDSYGVGSSASSSVPVINERRDEALEAYSFPKKKKPSDQQSLIPNSSTMQPQMSNIITSQGLPNNQPLEHLTLLAQTQNSPGVVVNSPSILFGNSNQLGVLNTLHQQTQLQPPNIDTSCFRKSIFEFFFRYVSVGFSLIPNEVFDEYVFGSEAMNNVFGKDLMSLLFAIHATTSVVFKNYEEAELAFRKSEYILPSYVDNMDQSASIRQFQIYDSNYTLARNLVLANYCYFIGNVKKAKRYLFMADKSLEKKIPNYANRSFLNCPTLPDDDDTAGTLNQYSVFTNLPNDIMLLMKMRLFMGIKVDEIGFMMERGLEYVNGLIDFAQPLISPSSLSSSLNGPIMSSCLFDDSTFTFKSFVGMAMLTSFFYLTGTIPSEVLAVTMQPLTSENIKIYLTLSLLLRKKIKGHAKARPQHFYGDQNSVISSPLAMLTDLFSLSCSILMLHETMCNQKLYNDGHTDQMQYTTVMFQYAEQMKDIIHQIPEDAINISYLSLGILYLLVMYFKQLEEIEVQAMRNGFSLHTNEAFQKQLTSLAIVHRYIAIIANKHPVAMEKFKGTLDRIGQFLLRFSGSLFGSSTTMGSVTGSNHPTTTL